LAYKTTIEQLTIVGATGWSDSLGKLPRHFGPPLERGEETKPPR